MLTIQTTSECRRCYSQKAQQHYAQYAVYTVIGVWIAGTSRPRKTAFAAILIEPFIEFSHVAFILG